MAFLHKWKKVLIGAALLSGFVFYTQYEKNAEPAWRVNEKSFTVVDSFKDGMEMEYKKFDELEKIDRFGFLKDSNKAINLNEKYRTLRIEKIWNMGERFYFLYSIDIKERDKDESDVPRMTVKKMKLHTKNGEEFTAPAHEYQGNYSLSNEGFVFKHRLYRSLMVFLMPDNEEQLNMDWELLTNIDGIELKEIDLADRSGLTSMEDINLRISSDNPYTKVIHKINIDKPFTYDSNKQARILAYEYLLYEQRLSLELPDINKNMVGFSGTLNDDTFNYQWDIIGTDKKGYHLQMYENPFELNRNNKSSITLNESVHKSDKTYRWSIPVEDIKRFNSNLDQPLERNLVINNENDIKIMYEGLTMYDGSPKIKFSFTRTNNQLPNNLNLIPERFVEDHSLPEEILRSYKKNVVSITNSSNEQLTNFEIYSENSNEKVSYYIGFFSQDDLEKGETNMISIPEDNLTVNLIDLTYSKPLPKPVTIKYQLPNKKK